MSGARWRLSVEDFGPIKSAAVTLAPFVVFSGQNNTGKSYLASLVWTLLNAADMLLSAENARGAAYDSAREVARAIQRGEKSVVAYDDWQKLLGWINHTLADKSANVVGRIFAREDLAAASIRADLAPAPSDMRVQMMPYEADDDERRRPHAPVLSVREIDGVLSFSPSGTAPPGAVGFDLPVLQALLRRGLVHYSAADYLPAARTGLMLALKTLVGSLLSRSDELPERGAAFTAPVRDFLVSISSASFAVQNWLPSIAQDLEKELLGGEIRQTDGGEIYFSPADAGAQQLPLHATSSLITELAPFVLLLKRGIFGTLIFEEPEAHLHLVAQRAVARALVKVVNAGVPVLVTTHSDTFLQQINILMQLHEHPKRAELSAEFGYDTSELLDPRDALGYRFEAASGGTVVQAMRKTSGGFVEPMMNETIVAQTHEVYRMERAEEDE